MIKKIFPLLVLGLLGLINLHAQTLTPEQYIARHKDFAIREMKRMGVPAAITLAQGLLETENGNSVLVRKSNNHFGIKCKSTWTAGGVSHDDDAPGECFRTYKDAEDSYRDHSNFLRGGERYAFLFNLDPSDYKGWAHGLKKAGYATNPKYPNILITSIERYNLQQYSLAGAKDVPKFDAKKFRDDPPVVFDANQKIEADHSINDKDAVNASYDLNSAGKVNYVNGNKCIWADKGTSLLAIATQHNINLRKLLDYNDLEEDGLLEEGQLIFLQKKSTRGEKQFYIVNQKRSYYDVAQQMGIQMQSILDYNQASEDTDLLLGTKVYLQPVAETDQANTIKDASVKTTVYQVQPREGLYSVAKKHNITVQQLKEWNNLTSDELKVGQELIIEK